MELLPLQGLSAHRTEEMFHMELGIADSNELRGPNGLMAGHTIVRGEGKGGGGHRGGEERGGREREESGKGKGKG